jgi:hypothetical protein
MLLGLPKLLIGTVFGAVIVRGVAVCPSPPPPADGDIDVARGWPTGGKFLDEVQERNVAFLTSQYDDHDIVTTAPQCTVGLLFF